MARIAASATGVRNQSLPALARHQRFVQGNRRRQLLNDNDWDHRTDAHDVPVRSWRLSRSEDKVIMDRRDVG